MKTKKIGNFRIDKDGSIDYYVGWCSLDYKETEDLKELLKWYNKVYHRIPKKHDR